MQGFLNIFFLCLLPILPEVRILWVTLEIEAEARTIQKDKLVVSWGR